MIHNKPFLIRLFADTLYRFLKNGQLTEKKVTILNAVLAHLQLAPLYQHRQFVQDFPWYFSWQHYNAQQHTHQQYSHYQHQHQHQEPPAYHHGLDDPFAVLKIKPTATHSEVKRAYRRQISRYHPDKLIAQGASTSSIKTATEKTQQIRKAYEKICELRGW